MKVPPKNKQKLLQMKLERMLLQMYLTDITCNPIKGEVNVDGRYTYHHHTRNDMSIGSK
jgi:hypothetical protein